MPCAACTTDRPPPFARRVHPLVLVFPFGVPTSVPPSGLFRSRLPYLAFFPLRDITGAVHQHGSTRSPAMFRPQTFSASRRLAPTTGFVGLFHPTHRVQGCSVQGFLPLHSLADSSSARPLMALRPFRSQMAEASCCHFQVPHLQGLNLRTKAFVRFGV